LNGARQADLETNKMVDFSVVNRESAADPLLPNGLLDVTVLLKSPVR
jgi:hypothetical protein